MKKPVLAAVVALSVFCGLYSQAAFGQAVYGSILGTVTDPSGAAVNGAKVTVTSQTKNTSVDTTSNDSGNYSVTHLIPDVYSIRVEGPGFKVLEFKDIQVSADSGARVDGQFQVGSTSEQVEVTSEAPQIKTDRADVAIEFNSKYVEDLPVLNRNFTTFELLSPGTQKLVGWSHAATENPQGGQQIFVNGQHFSGTAFELDGTDNQDPILGIIVVNPNLEAITETKIALQNYDAEFGKSVAGLVTVQTKSGSNDIHGSGFWFRRTDALAARDPFTQYPGGASIAKSKWQQFGGTIGGPIIKNKLFFFGDYQATRQTSGITNQYSIPTSTVLSTCNPINNPGGFCNLADYASKIGNGTPGDPTNYIYDPASSAATDGSGRKAFCGPMGDVSNPTPANCPTPYQIPIASISQQAGNILALLPQPSNSGTCAATGSSGCLNNFVASGSGPFSQNSFDTRIDYTASQSLNVFGRFSLDYFSLSGKGGLGALGGSGFGPGGLAGSSIIHNISLASGFTKTVSSSLLTDFRFGYFKYNPRASKPDAGSPMAALGIPGANLTGPQAAATAGLSSFFFDGTLSAIGDGLNVARCNCPLTEDEHQYQLVNNWTKIRGNHQFKFGTDLRFAHNLRVPSDANRTGQFNFNHLGTSNGGAGGLDLATFLLGDVTHLDRYVSTSLTAAESQKRIAFYGQDTWRVTSKLTFNYGLRWELYTPETVNGKDKGGFANIVGNGTNGGGVIRVGGEGGYGLNGNIGYDPKAFAPRIGLAYELNPRTVVRLGYGRSFDIGVFGSNFGHTVTQNLPVLVNQSISASNLGLGSDNYFPVFTLAQGPPAYIFPTVYVNGQLPLEGPGNNVGPKLRPTFQRLPTLDAWNATVQRQLDHVTSLEVAYIGNKGTHVFAGDGPSYNVNQPMIGPGADVKGSFVPVTPQAQRRPFYNAFATPCADVTCVAPVVICCSSDLSLNGNDASSIYNALQVKLERRFSHGLQFLTHYTFAHANHYDSNYYADSHPIAYGPDDQSRTHVWVTNVVFELPFGKGKTYMGNASRLTDAIIGGWQVTNTTNWSSGLPWTPSFGECGGEQDVGVCRPSRGSGSFKLGAGSLQHPVGASPYIQYFTPVANITTASGGPFADPGAGNLGNYGVFSLRGPHAFTSDAALSKNFGITERVKAQFRMDVFNLFNHPVLGFNGNQGGSGQCIDCSGQGRITNIEADSSPGSTTGMRQIEFALKVTF